MQEQPPALTRAGAATAQAGAPQSTVNAGESGTLVPAGFSGQLIVQGRSIGDRSPAPDRLCLEDWLLAFAVALLGPVLILIQGSGGPLDANRPLDGLLRMAGFLGALVCLATRSSDGKAAGEAPVLQTGIMGPILGGLVLVGASGFAALSLAPEIVFGPTFLIVIILAVAGPYLPAIPTATRRRLVTLFLMAAGSLFWLFVDSIVGGMDIVGELSRSWAENAGLTAFVGGALVAMAGVYYAMLVFAPRQFVEREGSPFTWLIRFAVFVACIALGLSWLAVLGT
jgi:hypothetical protein